MTSSGSCKPKGATVTKAELLQLIRSRRAELEALWAGSTTGELVERPGVQPDWSVKDLIGHMTYWEQYVIADTQLVLQGKPPQVEENTDKVNARVFTANKDRSLQVILADFQRSGQEMLDLVSSILESDLFDPNRFPMLKGRALADDIQAEYRGHYDAHLPDLRAWRSHSTGQEAIARLWHGVTTAAQADEYLKYLNKTGIPDLRATPGNQGVYVLRSIQGDKAHFLFVSLWESLSAIEAFAGVNIEKARYYPEDATFLLELEPTVTHYEVVVKP